MLTDVDLGRLLHHGYAPEGYWLWDPWVMKHGEWYYMFHLQLPKDYDVSINVPRKLAHLSNKVLDFHSTIGWARSKDLLNWQSLGTALERGEEKAWDDLALWTGCALEHEGQVFLFYTGRHANDFWYQQIGVAMSDDFQKFEKYHDNPITGPDGAFYGTSRQLNSLGMPPAWRDPFVFWDEKSQLFHMLVSARENQGEEYNACIGHAVSDDLIHWRLQQPLLIPEGMDQVENPQMQIIGGKYYLFFSVRKGALNPHTVQVMKLDAGLYGYVADDLEGPYKPLNDNGIVVGEGEELYSIQVIPWRETMFAALGWWQMHEGEYKCRLAKPFGLKIEGNKSQIVGDYFVG